MPNERISVFLPLLRHEFMHYRGKKSGNSSLEKKWITIYMAAILAILLALTTYFSLNLTIEMKYVWNICWGIPWITFGLSVGKMTYEWSNDTVGWWLTLPYSRLKLILAKFFAMLFQGALLTAGIYLLILLFGGYAAVISGSFSWPDFRSFIQTGNIPIALDFSAIPLAASTGLFLGTMLQTKWRPAMSLFWILWGALWAFVGTSVPELMNLNSPSFLCTMVISSWVTSGLLLLVNSWLLEKKLDL